MARVVIIKTSYSDIDVEALLKPFGGMEQFVEKGDRVLLKVNLLSAKKPEKAVTTHPEIIRAVARAVKEAGGEPFIGDSPGGTFSRRALRKAYRQTGLESLSKEADIPLNWDTGSRQVKISEGIRIRQVPVGTYALEADKIISLPKLKTHAHQYMTLACKNMFGVVPGLTKATYHARFPRRMRFADLLLDILSVVKPCLSILDGVLAMEGQGPGSGDPVELNRLMASEDPVALDIAACRLLRVEPVAIPVLKRAKIRNLWPREISYPLLTPESGRYLGFRLPATADHLFTGKKPPKKNPLVMDNCTACGDCAEICPKDAIEIRADRAAVLYNRCIRCYCCHEICPENAISLVSAGKLK